MVRREEEWMRNGAVTKLEGVTISDDPTGCGLHDFVVEMGSWKTIGETTKRAGRSQKKRKKSSLAGKRLGNETAEESVGGGRGGAMIRRPSRRGRRWVG